MCMRNPVRIESKDVPKYAYKVYKTFNGTQDNKLITYFANSDHTINKFNKPDLKKKSHKTIIHCHSALHMGRISVFINKSDAIDFCKNSNRNNFNSNTQAWKTQIKQTTKYAYLGKFIGDTLAVDQVKPIKRVF